MVSLSIVIPVYNAELYIRRCLDSITSQEGDGLVLECILVDDCGTDNTMSVISDMVENYSGNVRFCVLHQSHNQGVSKARNSGLIHATGDYVLFVDADDYLMPGSLRCFVEHLHLFPEADVVMGNVRNGKDGSMMFQELNAPLLLTDANKILQMTLRRQLYLQSWNKCIRRDILLANKILFPEGIIYEDEWWSYRLMSCVSSVLLLPQITYYYEVNDQSIVNTSFTEEKRNHVVASYLTLVRLLMDNPPASKLLIADYLLFQGNILARAFDVLSYGCRREYYEDWQNVRWRLVMTVWHECQIAIVLFMFVSLYSPMAHLKRWAWYRHHFYQFERAVGKLAHMTDFLYVN